MRPIIIIGKLRWLVIFLKSIDNKTWKVVIKGWKHPVVTSQDRTTNLKLEVDLSKDEDDEAMPNDKTLNSIFNGVERTCSY